MTNSLKKIIEKRLKENVPLTYIKKDLKQRGYSSETINKAVREAILSVDHRVSKVINTLIGILVIVILVVVIAIFTPVKPDYSNEKLLIQNFIQENLKSEFLPVSLNVEKITLNSKDIIGATWFTTNMSFTANVVYNSDIQHLGISVNIPGVVSVNKVTASVLAKTFFKNINENWICEKTATLTFCESMWEENGKKGVFILTKSDFSKTVVALCEIPKESKNYEKGRCVFS